MITNEMWQRAKEAFGFYPTVDKLHFTSDLDYYAFIATAATKAEILGDSIIHTITRKQVEEHFKEVKPISEYGYCPNCKSELTKNPKHAQGIFHCINCLGTYLIIETTKPTTSKQAK